MKEPILVKRYAEAMASYAKDSIGLDKLVADCKYVKKVFQDNPETMEFLLAPEVPLTEKYDFIDTLLHASVAEECRHFLKLLLEKGRINKLFDITEYIRVMYSYGQEVEALLKTTFPIDLEMIETIKKKLEEKFKKKLKLFIDLDGSLLGGVQVTIGTKVIDGSVRRRLEELREKLMTLRVV